MEFLGLTHKGMVRDNNEDSFACFPDGLGKLPNLAVIADGMGGHQAGEVASRLAIEFFVEYVNNCDSKELDDYLYVLTEGVGYANNKVFEASLFDQGLFGMGTTFTACVAFEGRLYIAHVGDSRLYCLNGTSMKLLTTDHTYTSEMVRAGLISCEEALTHPRRHALTKALGIDRKVEVDGYLETFNEGNLILMCSDGLTEMINDDEILQITKDSSGLSDMAQALISRANNKGGIDNITVILAKG